MKPKEDKVVVTINTEVIQDGLTNMGILITQEYQLKGNESVPRTIYFKQMIHDNN